jgi:2',3'-cyclic-nucleotide 2'-phosphodiesterase (5'-nucleotidase family)
LHAGDVFSRGDALTVYYGGEVNMMAMEAIGYDAFTPGNGEFYFGVENLMRQTSLVKFPSLLANVVYKKNGKRLFQPYMIKEVAGVKIAIIGVGFIRENHPSAWPIELLKEPKEFLPLLHIPMLRRHNVDVIIALTHTGLEQDKILATLAPQIDIIVGGHSHSKLDTPLRMPRPDGKGNVIIAQAGDYCRFLGRLDVHLESDASGKYQIANVTGKLLPIDSRIKDDIEITKLLRRYSEPLSEVICTSQVTLANPETGNSPMGNLVVEALRTGIGADVALLDRSAVRSEIVPGDVTIADIGKIHPWHNRVLELTLTGAQIKRVLAEQDILTSGCSYLNVNGKIRDLRIGLSPVELDKSYKVVAGEFLLAIAPSLRQISFTATGERVDSILLKYLKQIAVIEDDN